MRLAAGKLSFVFYIVAILLKVWVFPCLQDMVQFSECVYYLLESIILPHLSMCTMCWYRFGGQVSLELRVFHFLQTRYRDPWVKFSQQVMFGYHVEVMKTISRKNILLMSFDIFIWHFSHIPPTPSPSLSSSFNTLGAVERNMFLHRILCSRVIQALTQPSPFAPLETLLTGSSVLCYVASWDG